MSLVKSLLHRHLTDTSTTGSSVVRCRGQAGGRSVGRSHLNTLSRDGGGGVGDGMGGGGDPQMRLSADEGGGVLQEGRGVSEGTQTPLVRQQLLVGHGSDGVGERERGTGRGINKINELINKYNNNNNNNK